MPSRNIHMVDKVTQVSERFELGKDLTTPPSLPSTTERDDTFIGAQERPAEDEQSDKDKVRGTLSRNGESYDPTIHQYPPAQTKPGAWKKRRKARGDPTAVPNAEFRREGEKWAALYAQTLRMALGDGAEARENEMPILVDGFEGYFREKGVQELSPWVGLFLGIGSYTYGVATREKPANRIKRAWRYVVTLIFGDDKSADETEPVEKVSE